MKSHSNKRYHIHPPPKFVAAARALERPKRCTVNGVSIHLYHHEKVVVFIDSKGIEKRLKWIQININQLKVTNMF